MKIFYPYPCSGCGVNLEEHGLIIFMCVLPEVASAHLEPGVDDGIIIVLDAADEGMPQPYLQCFNCGADIKLHVEGVRLDIEFEATKEEEEKADNK